MKIIQIFGAVVAVHLLAFIFIFASPGCQSSPRTMPTPDATVPAGGLTESPAAYNAAPLSPQPVDLGTPVATYTPASPSGHAVPTRPGSAAAVAITPAKPVESATPVSTYTVERGDSLWSLAKKNNLTVAELAKANSIPTNAVLKPGRKLIVPGKVGAPAKESVPASAMSLPAEKTSMPVKATNGEATRHTVQVGESLGVIARRYGVNTGELAAANNITDPSKVRAGQSLIIPGGKTVRVPAAVAPASSAASTPAKPAETPAAPAEKAATPHFDITPPPPGQDLDSGLSPTQSEVPTIKVEEAPKN